MSVILRSPADGGRRRISQFPCPPEILRGACPEPVEGLRMTTRHFRMGTNYNTAYNFVKKNYSKVGFLISDF